MNTIFWSQFILSWFKPISFLRFGESRIKPGLVFIIRSELWQSDVFVKIRIYPAQSDYFSEIRIDPHQFFFSL